MWGAGRGAHPARMATAGRQIALSQVSSHQGRGATGISRDGAPAPEDRGCLSGSNPATGEGGVRNALPDLSRARLRGVPFDPGPHAQDRARAGDPGVHGCRSGLRAGKPGRRSAWRPPSPAEMGMHNSPGMAAMRCGRARRGADTTRSSPAPGARGTAAAPPRSPDCPPQARAGTLRRLPYKRLGMPRLPLKFFFPLGII